MDAIKDNYQQALNNASLYTLLISLNREYIGKIGQQYSTIANIKTPQKINYPVLHDSINASILDQAMSDYVGSMHKSPSK